MREFNTLGSGLEVEVCPPMRLQILPFRVAAYDKTTSRMAFFDPSRKEDFLFISGTMMRSKLSCHVKAIRAQ